MRHPQKGNLQADELDPWWVLAADGEIAGGLAASPLAVPAFLLGWIASPGTVDLAARWFAAGARRCLVLVAIDGSAAPGRW